jgi:hypothetical protein
MADQQSQQPTEVRKTSSSSSSSSSSPIKPLYLILYNTISAILWATILGRVILISNVHGTRFVFPGLGEFAKWTQTLALLEVVHAGLGEFSSFCFQKKSQFLFHSSFSCI